jgi:P-type Na+/K+ transporter
MADKQHFVLDQPAYRLSANEVARLLETSLEHGLSKEEARRRHEIVGDNALDRVQGISIWKVLVRQVANALTLVNLRVVHGNNEQVLIMAMALSYGTTDFVEGGVITAVIVRMPSFENGL